MTEPKQKALEAFDRGYCEQIGEIKGYRFTPSEVDTIRAALTADKITQSGWRDISEAPRDGTEILICTVKNKYVVCGSRFECGVWIDADTGDQFHNPTHWQPLPEPPK